MNRTLRYKITYVVLIFAGLGAMVGVYVLFPSTYTLVALAIILLIPGRIQGMLFRDLFRGRRLYDLERFEESLHHSKRFLELIRAKPHWKKYLWLSFSIYTPDVEAMVLYNLGTARLQLGRLEEARADFEAALEIDPLYPLPFYNLAVLAELAGRRDLAERYLNQAALRGYRRTSIDEVIHESQGILARIEGRVGMSHRDRVAGLRRRFAQQHPQRKQTDAEVAAVFRRTNGHFLSAGELAVRGE